MRHDDAGATGALERVLADVAAERAAQDAMWGVQEFPDGTGRAYAAAAERAKRECVTAGQALTWRHILAEEFAEALAESDEAALRTELIQTAAVAVKWAEAIDRRRGPIEHRIRPERYRAIVDVHVLLIRDGRVLLGRRAGTGYGDGQWHILPSGHLEAREPVTEAAVREAHEETGVTIDPADLTFAHVMHHRSAQGRIGLFFTTTHWTGEPHNAEPHKCSELAWFPLDALPPDLIAYPAHALAAIAEGRRFSLHGFD